MRSVVAACVVALSALATIASAGCKDLDPPPLPPFQFFVHVEADPGRPVLGATVSRNGAALATTGPDGRAMLTIPGAEGEIVDVGVKCPEAFTSPAKPLSIRLQRLTDKTKIPEYSVQCPPTMRRVVIAIRADNGPNLPVMYLEKLVTRTDASGAAHFALEVPPAQQFQVRLDTTDAPRLKPQNPSHLFTVGTTDEIMLFEQKFDVERGRVYTPPQPHVPRAL